jgi:hypothetical protein
LSGESKLALAGLSTDPAGGGGGGTYAGLSTETLAGAGGGMYAGLSTDAGGGGTYAGLSTEAAAGGGGASGLLPVPRESSNGESFAETEAVRTGAGTMSNGFVGSTVRSIGTRSSSEIGPGTSPPSSPPLAIVTPAIAAAPSAAVAVIVQRCFESSSFMFMVVLLSPCLCMCPSSRGDVRDP